MKVGREPSQHLIVSVLGSCCLKKGSSLGFFPVHMAPCGGRVLTQWLVYRSTAAARVSFPQRSPVLSKRILAVKFILVHECGDAPTRRPRLQYTVYDTGEISFHYTGFQGRTQDLVLMGALFKICLLSSARSVILGTFAPPPEQVLPPPRNINYD